MKKILGITAYILFCGAMLYNPKPVEPVESEPIYETIYDGGVITDVTNNVVCVACDPDGDGQEDEWACLVDNGKLYWRGQPVAVTFDREVGSDEYWIVDIY